MTIFSKVSISDRALVDYAAFRLENDADSMSPIKLELARTDCYIDFDATTDVHDGTTEVRAMFKFIPP